MPPAVSNASRILVSFLVLALLLPLLLVRWDLAEFANPSIWISYGVVLYASLRLALILGRGKRNWLTAGFWVFTYVFMGLALLAQIAAGRYPEERNYSETILAQSAWCIFVGLIAYDVGQAIAGSKNRLDDRPWERPLAISLRRTVILCLVGLVFAGVGISKVGIRPFFTSRDAVDEALQNRRPGVTVRFIKTQDKASAVLLQNAVKVPVFVGLYMLLLMKRRRQLVRLNRANQLAMLVLLLGLIFANVIVNNPIGTSRFWAGLVLMGILSVYVRLDSRRVFQWSIIGFLVLFLFAFSALDAFRLTDNRQFSRGGTVPEVLVTELDYATTQVAHEAGEYVRVHGYSFGRQFSGVVGLWVPRRVWENKPVPTGSMVNRGFVNVSSSLWTEGFIDFGLVGTALFLCFYGWGSRRLELAFFRSKPTGLATLMPLVVGYQFILVRGALMPTLGGLLFLLVTAISCFRHMSPQLGRPVAAAYGPQVSRT